jgi:hypothetical protein
MYIAKRFYLQNDKHGSFEHSIGNAIGSSRQKYTTTRKKGKNKTTFIKESASHHEKKRVACIASDTQEYKGPFVLRGVACYTSDTPAIMVSV